MVVRTSVSQPLAGLPSQSARPVTSVSQPSTMHVPETQVGVAGGATVQVNPHAPQLTSVLRSVSQPSLSLLLQSPQPGSQASIAHAPVEHAAIAWGNEQCDSHSPQLLKSSNGVSHPFVGSLSQLPQSASQPKTRHSPLLQPSFA